MQAVRSSVVTVPPTRAARTPEYIDTKGQGQGRNSETRPARSQQADI